MMNITLRATVRGDLGKIYARFDADLFRFLLPPSARLIEFGGSKRGDRVHLILPIVGEWVSEITEDYSSGDSCYFIDEGRKLPFPLKEWRHKHILSRAGNNTVIEDNINFTTGNLFADLIFYPILHLSFLPRTWQYSRYFKTLG